MTTPSDRAGELARLQLEILPQPDDYTCGPTCLHSVYRYYGLPVTIGELVASVEKTPSGGTADVYLANDALRRGFRATIYTYNLRIFDPTWFTPGSGLDIRERLRQQKQHKRDLRPVLAQLTDPYIEFLDLGGELRFVDLTGDLLRRYLKRGVPILTGLSSTYLYRHVREYGDDDRPDDVRGEPQGHFVVLCGYRPGQRLVAVADPFEKHPLGEGHHYEVPLERVIGAIMLGVLTHDANLLMIEPGKAEPGKKERP